MSRILLIGNVPPQTPAALSVLQDTGHDISWIDSEDAIRYVPVHDWDLIVVAGWRRLIPAYIVQNFTVVGFHSAKLPEYPGRAPVPWALIRGDDHTYNTLLYLDEGVDSGDIIAEQRIPIWPGDDPDTLYTRIAESCVYLLSQHLEDILAGTAPRTRQDPAKRGPLTSKDGWRLWESTRCGS